MLSKIDTIGQKDLQPSLKNLLFYQFNCNKNLLNVYEIFVFKALDVSDHVPVVMEID